MKNSLHAEFVLGFLGAGQLARMSALHAFRLGLQTAAYSDRDVSEPLQFLTPNSSTGSFDDSNSLTLFAKKCNLVTLENEFIDSRILFEVCENSGVPIYPSPKTFSLIENKLVEKQTFEQAGIPVTPYMLVKSDIDLQTFGRKYGWPFMLKSSKGGYDGYGNITVQNQDEAFKAFKKLGGHQERDIIAEAFVDFTHELAVQVARNSHGHVVYPVCETIQENHICVAVKSPARLNTSYQKKIQELAVAATEAIDGKGIFAYEFFLTEKGEILLNESAPRPHNSGHYSIEGCITSQFENHIRAVLDLPLGKTALRKPHAVMINLLGTHTRPAKVEDWEEAVEQSDAHLHIYGKLQSKPGRKMGHYTLLGKDPDEIYRKARQVTENIKI